MLWYVLMLYDGKVFSLLLLLQASSVDRVVRCVW